MSAFTHDVKTVAPLKNVALMMGLVQRLQERKRDLPGIGCFNGFSGYGKSVATAYAANKLRMKAVYLEARSAWTKKKFLDALALELGLGAGAKSKPIYDLVDLCAEAMGDRQVVLFVDEADHVVDRGYVEIIRDLYGIANTPIVLIGEERLPAKLERYERVHNRMLKPVPAQPCDLEDGRHLVKLYCDQVEIADDLLDGLIAAVKGCTRRVASNLDDVQEEALRLNWSRVDLKTWGDRGWNTGAVTIRRQAQPATISDSGLRSRGQ